MENPVFFISLAEYPGLASFRLAFGVNDELDSSSFFQGII